VNQNLSARTFSKQRTALLLAIAVIFALGVCPSLFADEMTHMVKGVVKSVDKGTKTMVVKTADGTEHTIKWTDKTVVKGGKDVGEGGKDVGEGIAEGSKVSVKYTEKGGEKTAVGVKDLGKATGKALSQ
jgi:hypothetical protein